MAGLNTLSARDAALRIARREITAEALVRDCLERISERNADVCAWEHLDPEAALNQAKALDRGPIRGPLHGVTLGVKDVFETFDMPTRHGTAIYDGNRPRCDAATVASARHGGMVVLGKTVTTELATHVPSRTRNPHNLQHTPGGSSSGSAAAVADHMVHLAIGTQTVGSTIRPASYCGVVGYKPTYNLISKAGVKVEGDSLDTVGVFGRTVADVALYTGAQVNDRRLVDLADVGPGLRIGFCRTPQWSHAQSETAAAIESAFKTLGGAKARVSLVELPKLYDGLLAAHWTVFCFELWRAFADEYHRAGDKLSESLRERWVEGSRISAETYLQAIAHAKACRAALPEAFGECDVLLVPSAPGEAPRGFATTGNPVLNQIWSILHTPAVTVPVAKGPNGLPVGLQIIGRHGEDWRALSAAQWIHKTLT